MSWRSSFSKQHEEAHPSSYGSRPPHALPTRNTSWSRAALEPEVYTEEKPKLVRRRSLQAYLEVFKSLHLDTDGTFSEREFEHHLQKTAPWLLKHAQGMYEIALRTTHHRSGITDDRGLDFHDVLAVVFPTATDKEVDALVDKATAHPPHEANNSNLHALQREARRVFSSWNTSGSGLLTRDECQRGMEAAHMPEEEVLDSLDELYDEEGREDIGIEVFSRWLMDMNPDTDPASPVTPQKHTALPARQ